MSSESQSYDMEAHRIADDWEVSGLLAALDVADAPVEQQRAAILDPTVEPLVGHLEPELRARGLLDE
jgi:hypothetical protein